MIKRLSFITILLVLFSLKSIVVVQAQEVSVYATEESLESVLIRIAPSISFDSHVVAPYKVTLRKDFLDIEKALDYLLKNTPLKYKKVGDVYVIYRPTKTKGLLYPPPVKKKFRMYHYQGIVRDSEEKTPMEYAIIHGKGLYVSCDKNGSFSFSSSKPHAKITLQFVGYQPLDTILLHGSHELSLRLANNTLEEVLVRPNASSLLMQYSDYQDHTLIHKNMMLDLPGTVDNSSWQTLRLMPSVRASGEPVSDPIIWGSTGDESAIYLDGMRLFVSNSMSKQIGVVNPMVIDHISVQKVNHDPTLGSHTGGIVEVKSRIPSKKTRIEGQVSNNLASLYSAIPITKKISFSVAYRHSFRELFDDAYLRRSRNAKIGTQNASTNSETILSRVGWQQQAGQQHNDSVTFLVHPDYTYSDFHAGVVGNWGKRNQHHVKMQLYSNSEALDYTITSGVNSKQSSNGGEGNRTMHQYSGMLHYGYQWKSSYITSLMSTYSKADNRFSVGTSKESQDVSVSENRTIIQHSMYWGNHRLLIDGGFTQYSTRYLLQKATKQLYSTGLKYRYQSGQMVVQADGHMQYFDSKMYWSPQLYLSYQVHPRWKLQFSGARYHQFLYAIDEDRQQTGEWIRVWHLDHVVASNQLSAHVYYLSNLLLVGQRLIYQKHENTRFFNSIESVDASGEVWGEETYAKLQLPTAYITTNYSCLDVPMSSQLWHEWKSAATWHLGDCTLSSQYIYGNGFELTGAYHRFDSGISYNFSCVGLNCTVGASVLNVFNSDNIQSQAYVLQPSQGASSLMFTQATKRTWLFSGKIIF